MHPSTHNAEMKLQINKYSAQICKEKMVHTLIFFLVDDRTGIIGGFFCFVLSIRCVTVIQMRQPAIQYYKLG